MFNGLFFCLAGRIRELLHEQCEQIASVSVLSAVLKLDRQDASLSESRSPINAVPATSALRMGWPMKPKGVCTSM